MRIRPAPVRHAPAIAIGCLALSVSIGGIAYATSRGPKTISVCVHKRGGGWYSARRCRRHDRRLKWNVLGRRGPAGSQGPRGATGRPGGRRGARGPRGFTGARGPKGDTGARGATGATGSPGFSSATISTAPVDQDVASTDPANPTVMSTLTLGPGSYVITANGWARGRGPGPATIHCGVDTASGDQSIGESLGSSQEGSVTTTLPVSVNTTGSYRFNCYRLGPDAMHLVRSQLTAVKVGAITNQ
jgi:Collagen triple helix repeat (20 copies)